MADDACVRGHSAASPLRTGRGNGKKIPLLDRRHGLDADLVALREGVDDLLDQHLRRRGAGREAEAATAPNVVQSMSAARCSSSAWGQPLRTATSLSRCEFDELGEPTTIMASTTGATCLTASWRLVVA